MSRLLALLLVLLALIPRIAQAQAAKIFTDKGSTWIRSRRFASGRSSESAGPM